MQEEWRQLYDKYLVSNTGKVFSKAKNVLMKQSSDKDGYKVINLVIEGKSKSKKVHRLVAEAFLENYSNNLQVNHKDENKTNNSLDNLEMCTNFYNCNYGSRRTKLAKPIIQKSLDGIFIKEWQSINDIKRVLGYNNTPIIACCRGYLKEYKNNKIYPVHHAYNYIWEYKQ